MLRGAMSRSLETVLEVSWLRFRHLEEELARLRLPEAWAALAAPVVEHAGRQYAWPLPDSTASSAPALALCQSFEQGLGVPSAYVAVFGAHGLVRTSRDFALSLQMSGAKLAVCDARALPLNLQRNVVLFYDDSNNHLERELEAVTAEMQLQEQVCPVYAQVLRIVFGEKEFEWDVCGDFDRLQPGEVDVVLKENVEYHLDIPFTCQAICDEYGPLITSADFDRALQRLCPRLTVFDVRADSHSKDLKGQPWLQPTVKVTAPLRLGAADLSASSCVAASSSWRTALPQGGAPEGAAAGVHRGLEQMRRGRHEEALQDFEAALRAEPRGAAALAMRGACQLVLRRFADAAFSLDQALALQPHDAFALACRGAVMLELGRLAAALQDLNAALALWPTMALALGLRGTAKRLLGRGAEALADLDAALAHEPSSAFSLSSRGATRLELGRYGEALRDFRAALELNLEDVRVIGWAGTAQAMLDLQSSRQCTDFVACMQAGGELCAQQDGPARQGLQR